VVASTRNLPGNYILNSEFQYRYSFCIDSSPLWHYSRVSPSFPFRLKVFRGARRLLRLSQEEKRTVCSHQIPP